MNLALIRAVLLLFGLAEAQLAQAAVDSYRFAHVTISTPWYIFIFLLMGVFAPFVLMVVLAWRNAVRKTTPEMTEEGQNPSHQ
jgi:uncharacterized membrane protein YadS